MFPEGGSEGKKPPVIVPSPEALFRARLRSLTPARGRISATASIPVIRTCSMFRRDEWLIPARVVVDTRGIRMW